jgi:hypothetical protein
MKEDEIDNLMKTETPKTDKKYNRGEEWRGVPSPQESYHYACELERENARLRILLDPDKIIAECVPGGDICDPQQVADSLRAYIAERKL